MQRLVVIAFLCFAFQAARAKSAAPLAAAAIELVESAPVETTLRHADVAQAADVWRDMIASATKNIDLAEFYVVSQPGSRLEPVLDALVAATKRGVHVRLLVDAGFAKHEHTTLDRLQPLHNLEIRRLDLSAQHGILHAKYFIVDDREAYLGSQNFDWRSLEHIQELGVRIREPVIAGALLDVFNTDWVRANDATAPVVHAHDTTKFPLHENGALITLAYSARGQLPDEKLWDLPKLVELIDSARHSVRVQVLTYQANSRGQAFDELDAALHRAAARNVSVELLIADWCKRQTCVEGLKKLAALPNIKIKLVTIPPFSGGFIPYARVIHAKYLVIDGARAWIGTSNWERDYFYASRNVGVIVAGGAIPPRLDRFFADDWNSPYAELLDVNATYVAPVTH